MHTYLTLRASSDKTLHTAVTGPDVMRPEKSQLNGMHAKVDALDTFTMNAFFKRAHGPSWCLVSFSSVCRKNDERTVRSERQRKEQVSGSIIKELVFLRRTAVLKFLRSNFCGDVSDGFYLSKAFLKSL